MNIFYNADKLLKGIESGRFDIHILTTESTCRWGKNKSTRLVLEHLKTSAKRKNWASTTLEQSFNSHFNIYATDLYNYGNTERDKRIHYYNVGASYSQGGSRLAVSYGRQRGGLICSGGVCRYVPDNTGLNIQLSTTF